MVLFKFRLLGWWIHKAFLHVFQSCNDSWNGRRQLHELILFLRMNLMMCGDLIITWFLGKLEKCVRVWERKRLGRWRFLCSIWKKVSDNSRQFVASGLKLRTRFSFLQQHKSWRYIAYLSLLMFAITFDVN